MRNHKIENITAATIINMWNNLIYSRDNIIYVRIREQEKSLLILKENYKDLKIIFNRHSNPIYDEKFWKAGKNKYRLNLHKKLRRGIHNYIASTMTFIEHTNVILGKIFFRNDPNIIKCQNKMNDCFYKDPIFNFIKKFRNYTLHYALPRIISSKAIIRKSSKINNPITKVTIYKNELLLFNGWNSYAKKHINSYKLKVDLEETFEKYNNNVDAFHTWLQIELRQIHLKSIINVTKEMNSILEMAISINKQFLLPYDNKDIEKELKQIKAINKNGWA